MNQFQVMRDQISAEIKDYKKALRKCKIKQKWHSKTILRKAAPFLDGHFTLAVVGKMSSGKSTFINTLIGADLLPTGHFQTTSAITYIENADTPKMVVSYCDGHEETFTENNIKTSLTGLVSVDPYYSSLPINAINDLIAGGDSLDEVLSKKFEIEQKTKTKATEDLWIQYYESHPKSSIAEQVHIFYPLSDEFCGWQIIDTPGVGAIGGIQDETKKLFAKRDNYGSKCVDAIIFLQRGDDNMEDSANIEFVENTFAQLTDEAKSRLFFVLTHATTQKFRLMRDEILAKAKDIFLQAYNIPTKRFTYVDSLIARFKKDLEDNNTDIIMLRPDEDDIPPLEGWDPKEWACMLELLSPIKRELKNRGEARNNETILSLMEEWGNFKSLKDILNSFVKDVKTESAQEIISLIQKDYKLIVENYKNEIALIEGGENAISETRNELTRKRIEYSNILNKLRRAAAIEPLLKNFSFVDEELESIGQKKTIDEVRITYQNIMDEALRKEKDAFSTLENQFHEYCENYDSKDIILAKIDFAELCNQAHKDSTTQESVYKDEAYSTGGMSPKTKTRTVYAGTKDVTDQVKKLEKFKQLVRIESRKIRDSFFCQLRENVSSLCKYVEQDIDIKMTDLELRLDEIESNLDKREKELTVLHGYVNYTSKISKSEPYEYLS